MLVVIIVIAGNPSEEQGVPVARHEENKGKREGKGRSVSRVC